MTNEELLAHNADCSKVESLKEVLMRRDKLSSDEADNIIDEAMDRVTAGENPETILHDEFGLEPDYMFDLIRDF